MRSSFEQSYSSLPSVRFRNGGRRGQGFPQPKPQSVPRARPLPKPGPRR